MKDINLESATSCHHSGDNQTHFSHLERAGIWIGLGID